LKGLLISLAIVLLIAAVGVGASAIVHINLLNSLDSARKTGFREGDSDGYEKGLIEGSIAGYQEGSKHGYLTSNGLAADGQDGENFYFIYNPTYEEVKKILDNDELDSIQNVIDYSVINGIRIAYVRVQTVPSESKDRVHLYELVAFETVNNGFIIIEPESHSRVQVEVGESYSRLNGLPAPSYDDTIGKVTVIW
jgi:hypothetical protein